MLPVLPPETPVAPTRPPLVRWRVAVSVKLAVGKNPARACATIASAWRKAAAAAFKFWFEMSIWRSRLSSTARRPYMTPIPVGPSILWAENT